MTRTRKLLTVSIASVLVLGIAPALVACSPQQLVQDAVENAVKDVTGIDVNIDGTTMPEGFPAEVPVISGDIGVSGSLGVGADQVWTVSFTVPDLAAAFEEATGKLLSAGFASDFDATVEGASTGSFSNASFTAIVTATSDGTSNTVTYVVASKPTQ
jgi:hypothetical protein